MDQFPPADFLAAAADHGLNWRTALRELAADRQLELTGYEVEEWGPDHQKSFRARFRVGGRARGVGQGHRKKEALQRAAEEAWISITVESAASQ
jgi:ribonuclease-3